MSQRAQNITGTQRSAGRETVPDAESVTLPADAADPTTAADESSPSWRDRLTANRWRLVTYSFILATLLGIIAYFVVTILPGLLANPLVQGAAVVVTLAVLFHYTGWARRANLLDDYALVIEKRPDGAVPWIMQFDTGSLQATPHNRGVSFVRGVRGALSVEDLGDEYVTHTERYGGDADDDATIQYPKTADVTETWLGTIVTATIKEHKPAGGRPDIDVIAVPSADQHEEDVEDLLRMLDERDDRIERLFQQVDEQQAEIERLRDKIDTAREQEREDMRQLIDVVAPVRDGRRTGGSADASANGSGPSLQQLRDKYEDTDS